MAADETEPEPEVVEAAAPEQVKALAHPLRHALLCALPAHGATVSQLARTLATNKGNVSHHLRVLLEAELVRLGPSRTVRGGTERYYLPAAERLRFPATASTTAAMMTTLAAEIPDGDDHLLNSRHLRLTEAQANAVAAHLERLVHDLPQAPPGAPTYGILVGVYRRREHPRQPEENHSDEQ